MTPAQAELVDAVVLAQRVRGQSLSQIPDAAILSILLEFAPEEKHETIKAIHAVKRRNAQPRANPLVRVIVLQLSPPCSPSVAFSFSKTVLPIPFFIYIIIYIFVRHPHLKNFFQNHERLEVFVDGSPSIIRPTGWGLNKVLRKVGGFETACIGAYREKEGVLEYVWLYLLRLSLTGE